MEKQQEQQKNPSIDLICPIKYGNSLPEIPFDPKLLESKFDIKRFSNYMLSSLENSYCYDLWFETDCGISVNLIDLEQQEQTEYNTTLHEDDLLLLEDESENSSIDSKRTICHNRVVPWLKKTEYISSEVNHYGEGSGMKVETKVGFNLWKKMKPGDNQIPDRENQIASINKTFELAKKPIVSHPVKSELKPVDILPLFPDFDCWKYPFASIQFDSTPMVTDKESSQAMIRGMIDETDQQFVGYFLPNNETLRKLSNENPEEGVEYEYLLNNEFNWNFKNIQSETKKGEHYFFIWRNDSIYYNELATRVRLTKRRLVRKKGPLLTSKLIVKHRPMNEQELNIQKERLAELEPPVGTTETDEVNDYELI
ncbi:RNA polymerase-associated factor [Blomia tropicalis]|nr:RNA polymerase-associated factor [Blomia tropicalis]